LIHKSNHNRYVSSIRHVTALTW